VSYPTVRQPPGKAWGVVALAAALIPVPFLVLLNILSLVVRGAPADDPAFVPAQWIYGIVAVLGVLFFTVFFLLALAFGITAVTRPRRAGRVLGWTSIAIVIVAIPFLWTGYLVWIQP
jgi:hypothetical protein